MKKLLLTSLVSTAILATTFTASANSHRMGNNFEYNVENITQMFERRLEMRGNKNIKLDSVTEKDGKFVVRITTADGELVEEKIIDPASSKRGMKGGMMDREPLTLEQAQKIIEGRLAMRGNPNVKLGEIKEVDGKFVATITTQKGSLVEEITIDPQNPHGAMMKDHMGKGKMKAGKGGMDCDMKDGMKGGMMKDGMKGKMGEGKGKMQKMNNTDGETSEATDHSQHH